MKEPTSSSDKAPIITGVGTLIVVGISYLIAGQLSSKGDLTIPAETFWKVVGAVGTIICGLVSYIVILSRRTRKIERVRSAKELGRIICPCSETGEIMIHCTMDDPNTGKPVNVIKCPGCKKWEFFFYDDVTDKH